MPEDSQTKVLIFTKGITHIVEGYHFKTGWLKKREFNLAVKKDLFIATNNKF